MLDDVRFVMAAVAKKAYVAELTHFQIKEGRITGYNGQMALSSSIGVDLNVLPAAAKFMAAIKTCEGTISLHVTPAGKLSVRAGKFKVLVDCLPDDGSYYRIEPEGEEVTLGDNFLKGFTLLSPLMGVDASRKWAMGIKVTTGSMHATNNVIVGQFWHGAVFPYDVVIPAEAVNEILRIGTSPTKVQVTPSTATFWFGDERWLKTNLLEGDQWPIGRLNGALDAQPSDGQVPFPAGFFEAVETLKPFLAEDGAVYIRNGVISTSREDGEGASVEVTVGEAPELMSFSHKQLTLLGEVATAIDWRSYPRPCMFTHQGEHLRGLMVGRVV